MCVFAHHVAHGVLEHERQEDPDEHDQERVSDRPERRQHARCRSDQQHRSHRQEQRSHRRRADSRVIWSGHHDLRSAVATRRCSSGLIKSSLSTVGLLRADDPKPCKAYPASFGLVESRRDNVPCRGDRSCRLDMLPRAAEEDRQGHDGRPDGYARPRAPRTRARLCGSAIRAASIGASMSETAATALLSRRPCTRSTTRRAGGASSRSAPGSRVPRLSSSSCSCWESTSAGGCPTSGIRSRRSRRATSSRR